MNRHERAERRQRVQKELAAYRATHTEAEYRRHVNARYPSGRWSHGGANRSSNIKRESHLRVTHVTLCPTCGGSSPEVALLSSLYLPCTCL